MVTDNNTIHVPLSDDLSKKLKTLAAADRRKVTDFIRLLIEQEWDRRKDGVLTAKFEGSMLKAQT